MKAGSPLLASGLAFALATAVVAVAAELPALSPSTPIDENYFATSYPATTNFIKGMLIGEPDADVDVRDLRVRLPKRDGSLPDHLCVDLQSIDGRYRGHVAYALPPSSSGPHRLKLGTRLAKELRRYRARELAVLAYLTSDCLERPRDVLPVSWGPATEERVIILVNSIGADGMLSIPGLERQCAASPAKARDAFQLECRLDKLNAGKNVMTVGIYRFEELKDEETVAVWSDGSP